MSIACRTWFKLICPNVVMMESTCRQRILLQRCNVYKTYSYGFVLIRCSMSTQRYTAILPRERVLVYLVIAIGVGRFFVAVHFLHLCFI